MAGGPYAGLQPDDTLLVLGAGPIGDMTARIAIHDGHRVIVVGRVPERLERVRRFGAETIDMTEAGKAKDIAADVRARTSGRGPDAVVDAVGMEAHGSPVVEAMTKTVGLLPGAVGRPLMKRAGVDRMAALHLALEAVRRGGTVSISGVYRARWIRCR